MIMEIRNGLRSGIRNRKGSKKKVKKLQEKSEKSKWRKNMTARTIENRLVDNS